VIKVNPVLRHARFCRINRTEVSEEILQTTCFTDSSIFRIFVKTFDVMLHSNLSAKSDLDREFISF